jgi:hypothetical protein
MSNLAALSNTNRRANFSPDSGAGLILRNAKPLASQPGIVCPKDRGYVRMGLFRKSRRRGSEIQNQALCPLARIGPPEKTSSSM